MESIPSTRPSLPLAKDVSSRRAYSPAQILAIIASVMLLFVPMLGCGISSMESSKLPSAPAVTPTGSSKLPPVPSAIPVAISTHEIAQTMTLIGGQTGPVIATCPQGEIALSGGWDIPSQSARVFAAMVINNGWAVSVLPVGHPATITVTAYVECLRGATGTIVTQRANKLTIAPTIFSATVDNAATYLDVCQQNEGLVGFGFDFSTSGASQLELESSIPSDVLHVISWSFKVWNYDTVAHDVTFDVECATTTLHGAVTYPQQKGSLLYIGMSGSAMVPCPTGTMMAGGGFIYTLRGQRTGHVGNEYHLNAAPIGWQSSLIAFKSYGLFAIYPEAIAVCLILN